MAKKRIQQYIFVPGVSGNSNAYPNAYDLITANKEFIKDEASKWIDQQIITDSAVNLFPNAVTLLTNNKEFLKEEITAWIGQQTSIGIAPFGGYTYDAAKCKRDVGYVIDAYINDIRFGGNEKTIEVVSLYWVGSIPQVDGDRAPEVAAHVKLRDIINNYIFTRTLYPTIQGTAIQNVSGSNAEVGASTRITVLSTIVTDVIDQGLDVLPALSYGATFANYTYNNAKCERDIGYVLDAYLWDLRYGGNRNTRKIAGYYWIGGAPQIDGDRTPEVATHNFIRDLINNYIIKNLAYASLQSPVVTTQTINLAKPFETGADTRITYLSGLLTTVIQGGLDVMPALISGAALCYVQGKWTLDQLLIITNVTHNEILYNFADPATGVTQVYADPTTPDNDTEIEYGFTGFVLAKDTTSMSATDQIQIFVEDYLELKVRPYDFGTDAIERQRVATAQSMLDADFEYGLQPTKWQAISLARSYPSVYEIPGTDTAVVTITTDASATTGGTGQSLITVTTVGAHGLTPGVPFIIRALNTNLSGFSRAEGVFLVNSTPSSTQFTYFAKAKVGSVAGSQLQETYTLIRRGQFYTGASVGTPTFSVFSQGASGSFLPALNVPSGSTVIPYAGSIPPNGAPVTNVTSINPGTQITAVTGTGSTDTESYTGLTGINVSGIGVGAEFTVDRTSGVYSVTVTTAGTDYEVGDQIVIYGTSLDGTSPGNDLLITVATITGVGTTGPIATVTSSGSGVASGVTASQTILETGNVGTSTLVFSDTTGIIPGLAMNRGDGTATIVTDVSGTTVTISRPLTTAISGSTDDFPNLAPTPIVGTGTSAQLTITRTGTSYSVTAITNAGTGYRVGDTLFVSGSSLGGSSPTNDAYVVVSAITGPGPTGPIGSATVTGIGIDSNTYTGVAAINLSGLGSDATFNVTRNGANYNVTIQDGGTGYVLGDKIRILGTSLGGATPANDLTITVTEILAGVIVNTTSSGTGALGSASYPEPDIDSSAVILDADGAQFSVSRSGPIYSTTLVNGGSTRRTAKTTNGVGIDYSTSIKKYGSASLIVNNALHPTAASQYVTFASSSDFAFGTGDFTIEFWFRRTSGSQFQTLFDMRSSAATEVALTLGLNTTNQPYLFINGAIRIQSTSALLADTFQHIEIARVSGVTRLFVDGSQVGTDYTDSNNYGSKPIRIGADYNFAYGVDGYFDDFRVSKGLGRHSSTFTAPAEELQPDSSTVLLLNMNTSPGSVTVSDDVGGYKIGNQIIIRGTELGGATPANDLTITVSGATLGVISAISTSGTALDQQSFSAVSGTNITGQGSSAAFAISRSGTSYVSVLNTTPGTGYTVGDRLKIAGTSVGGATPANDITLEVLTIGGSGEIGSISILSGTALSSTQAYTSLAPTNVETRGTGLVISVHKESGSYSINEIQGSPIGGDNYSLGQRFTITGDNLGGSFGTNNATITITGIDTSGSVTTVSITGTAAGGSSVDFFSTVTISEPTISVLATTSVITFSAIAKIQVDFLTPHGFVPGMGLLVNITSASLNQNLAAGSFFVEEVPTPTRIRYTARSVGNVTPSGLAGIVYTRADTFFSHRPFDGGVQLGTGGPQHGSQAIRMSKNYIRYQSGKGLMYTTGALFAPSYDILRASSTGVGAGSVITFVTDDVDHGLQAGADVRIIGIETVGYNGTYTVASIIDERTFTIIATQGLGSTTATLSNQAQVSMFQWSGATVRAGCFDDQNGMYWQYNGQRIAVGVRSATFQIAGSVTATPNSNTITGSDTRFRDQLKAGDKIVIRGMTHTVTSVESQTLLYVAPDYRGANTSTKVKLCKIDDRLFYQDSWNRDSADGTGPSGYNIDVTKMQMIGIQYTWYGAGFIDFMLRGKEGDFLFVHRIRNNNVNTEAFMRSANLPVRYEVVNDGAVARLSSNITASSTSVPLDSTEDFPDTGTVYIDNELISYTSKTSSSLTGLTRAATMQQFAAGSLRSYTAGSAASHNERTGVVLVGNRTSPVISHWGSAYLTDGGFDADRGYLFNYQATSFVASTTRATAFLIRLAPSVSNAIVGDLGDRELINRAQLLLQGIEVTAGSGSASGIVVEGVLNPSNYPQDPTLIEWRTLANPALGGLPSFAQVALGSSVTWDNTFTVTFAAFSVLGPYNRTYFLRFLATETTNVRPGMIVSSPTPAVQALIPGGMTVTGLSGIFNIGGTNYREVYFNRNFLGNVTNGSEFSFSSLASYAAPGEAIFSFVGLPNAQTQLDLRPLKEITNTAIGGRGMYPNGPDVLAINCFLTGGSTQEVSIVLRWSEAQA
jgi:hypothetical protein